MSLNEKSNLLRQQLGYGESTPLHEIIATALVDLGLEGEAKGMNLPQKVDVRYHRLDRIGHRAVSLGLISRLPSSRPGRERAGKQCAALFLFRFSKIIDTIIDSGLHACEALMGRIKGLKDQMTDILAYDTFPI